ncbi:MAG: hypothetical protein HQL66_12035 [Magnetococcales bacterium]|nr:hypothetical protein [Magnetococcales bacterium]
MRHPRSGWRLRVGLWLLMVLGFAGLDGCGNKGDLFVPGHPELNKEHPRKARPEGEDRVGGKTGAKGSNPGCAGSGTTGTAEGGKEQEWVCPQPPPGAAGSR